jgi:hypothetical protein
MAARESLAALGRGRPETAADERSLSGRLTVVGAGIDWAFPLEALHLEAPMKLTLSMAAVAALLAGSFPAHADYVCEQLPDVPGAVMLGEWRANNAGDFVVDTDLGPFVYQRGTYVPLAAAEGIPAANVVAEGINDTGAVCGAATMTDGHQSAFILDHGAYSFFDAPGSTFPEARGINNLGLVTGYGDGGAFVYNPTAHPRGGYPVGFTPLIPTRPTDGAPAFFTIASQINDRGVVVGNGWFPTDDFATLFWAFAYDPKASPAMRVFRVNDHNTRARGINNKGQIVGFTPDPAAGDRNPVGFLLDGDVVELIHCENLDAWGVFAQGITDNGEISGGFNDVNGGTHPFIARRR